MFVLYFEISNKVQIFSKDKINEDYKVLLKILLVYLQKIIHNLWNEWFWNDGVGIREDENSKWMYLFGDDLIASINSYRKRALGGFKLYLNNFNGFKENYIYNMSI